MDERDEEWLAAQNGSVEMLTKKERHAILIGCNKYSDHRIRDLTHRSLCFVSYVHAY